MPVMCRESGKWILDDLEQKIQAVNQLVTQIKGEVVLDRQAGIDYLEHINSPGINMLEMEIMELIDERVDGVDVYRVKGIIKEEGVIKFDIQILYKGKVISV